MRSRWRWLGWPLLALMLGGCADAGYYAQALAGHARLLSAVWGETIEPQELLLLGERIWNAERLFNLAAGFTRADDTLPARLLHEPVPSGPSAGHVVDLPPMLDEYYISRGWDGEGRPSPAKVERLGLGELAAEIEAAS